MVNFFASSNQPHVWPRSLLQTHRAALPHVSLTDSSFRRRGNACNNTPSHLIRAVRSHPYPRGIGIDAKPKVRSSPCDLRCWWLICLTKASCHDFHFVGVKRHHVYRLLCRVPAIRCCCGVVSHISNPSSHNPEWFTTLSSDCVSWEVQVLVGLGTTDQWYLATSTIY